MGKNINNREKRAAQSMSPEHEPAELTGSPQAAATPASSQGLRTQCWSVQPWCNWVVNIIVVAPIRAPTFALGSELAQSAVRVVHRVVHTEWCTTEWCTQSGAHRVAHDRHTSQASAHSKP